MGMRLMMLLSGQRGGGSAVPLPSGLRPGAAIWLHAGDTGGMRATAVLARRLVARRSAVPILVTHAAELAFSAGSLPAGCILHGEMPTAPNLLRRSLESWRPAALALIGGGLEPGPMHLAGSIGVPLLLAHMKAPSFDRGWRLLPGLVATLLKSCHRIVLPDAGALRTFRRAGAPETACLVAGPLCETAPALPHTEAERQEIATTLAARPVWLAAGLPEAELQAVLAAHAETRRLAHRLLLIIVPARSEQGTAMQDAIAASGNRVSRRSAEQEIDMEDTVYVADTDGEYGLWYRLAPVTFMGGSLRKANGGSVRDPMEAAALGSAVIHGPAPGVWGESYRALVGAGATRPLRHGGQLADCLSELLAPDRAASLACEGWRVSSEGAEATEILADELLALVPDRSTGIGAAR